MKYFLTIFLFFTVLSFAQVDTIVVPGYSTGAQIKEALDNGNAAMQELANADTSIHTRAEIDTVIARGLRGDYNDVPEDSTVFTSELTAGLATKITSTSMDNVSEFDTQIGLTGTASSSTYLRGDGSWQTVTGSLTAVQETEIGMSWAYLALDTTGVDPEFPDSTGAAVSTVVMSKMRAVGSNDVGRIKPLTSSEYRTVSGTTRSSWYSTERYVKDIDSIQVRDTTSATNEVTTLNRFYIAGVTDTFSVTTVAGGGNAYVTDSLKLYWDDEDLSNGLVSSWTDKIRSLELTSYADSTRPTMGVSGLTFDGNDGLQAAFPFDIAAYSFEIIVEVVDSTKDQWFAIVNDKDNNANGATIGLKTNKFGVRQADGTNLNDLVFSSRVIGELKHIVGTYDNSSDLILYINGTATVDYTSVILGGTGQTKVMIGSNLNSADWAANGTKIRLIRYYNRVLTPTEVTTNYNSDSVQDKLP